MLWGSPPQRVCASHSSSSSSSYYSPPPLPRLTASSSASEIYEMDADVVAADTDLSYMKGEQPHVGFNESSWDRCVNPSSDEQAHPPTTPTTRAAPHYHVRCSKLSLRNKLRRLTDKPMSAAVLPPYPFNTSLPPHCLTLPHE
jgi:hypothetical protein